MTADSKKKYSSSRGFVYHIRGCTLKVKFEVDEKGRWIGLVFMLQPAGARRKIQNGTVQRQIGKPKVTRQEYNTTLREGNGKTHSRMKSAAFCPFQAPMTQLAFLRPPSVVLPE